MLLTSLMEVASRSGFTHLMSGYANSRPATAFEYDEMFWTYNIRQEQVSKGWMAEI